MVRSGPPPKAARSRNTADSLETTRGACHPAGWNGTRFGKLKKGVTVGGGWGGEGGVGVGELVGVDVGGVNVGVPVGVGAGGDAVTVGDTAGVGVTVRENVAVRLGVVATAVAVCDDWDAVVPVAVGVTVGARVGVGDGVAGDSAGLGGVSVGTGSPSFMVRAKKLDSLVTRPV